MRKFFLKPENRRWFIVAIAFLAIVVNYVDRQIVSILKPILKVEFDLDDSGYAVIVNIFTACYAVMYPVTGWMVDKFGPKKVMFWGVITWSLACIGGGIAKTMGQFGFSRGLLGLAEPTNFPASVKVTTIWFPGRLRATANSLCQAGGSIGAILAPPIIAWLTIQYGWQSVFMVMGVFGLLVAVLWYFIYRDPPSHILEESVPTSPTVNNGHFTWPQLWKTKSLWGILLIRFISDPVWYFCLFWLPGYLQEESGLTLVQIGMFGWIPFLLADTGAIGSSVFSDRMVRNGHSPLTARKKMLTVITCFTPICCVLVPFSPNAAGTLIIFSIIAVTALTWLLTINVVVAEAFPVNNVASVIGIAGGCGALGAVIFNTFVGAFIGTIGAGKIFLAMAVLQPIALLLLWAIVRKEQAKSTVDS